MKKVVLRGLIGVGALAALVVAGFRVWLSSATPPLSGRETVPALADSVVVLWDSLAVPHIIASSDSDFFVALGYLHARDRMWEMDLLRHVAEGRLSELFGSRALNADRLYRSLEVGRLAVARRAAAGPAALLATTAYAKGVNAWLAAGHRAPEFRLLGHRPERWRPEQSFAIGLLEAWDLHADADEIEFRQAVATLGAAKAADLFVPYPDSAPVIVESSAGAGGAAWRPRVSSEPRAAASNSWVIGPRHTRSGRPILANDPHLNLRVPSLWYLVGAHAPSYEVVGATIPGMPAVVLGHTAHHGWGFTNGQIDDVDYVAEWITPDSARYRTLAGWADVEIVAETIGVKGSDPVIWRRRRTVRGPLVDVGWRPDTEAAFSLRWTGQEPADELSALLGMARATDLAGFERAIETFRVPEQNVVYADRDGNIAYFLAGYVPVRRFGDGSAVTEGWTDSTGWIGYLAPDELPRALNPPSGFIVTANNRIVGAAFPRAIPADYELPYRAARIWEMLGRDRRDSALTAATVAREQMDQVNVFLRGVTPMAAQAAAATGGHEWAESLRRWDGTMAADRREPTLVWSWYRELQRLTYDDEIADYRPSAPLHRWLKQGASLWFDDVRTPQRENLDTLARRAMELVLARGKPPPWGEALALVEEHALGAVPILGRLAGFNIGPLHPGGGNYTVNVCPSREFEPPFSCTEGPSMRHVVDFGDVDGAGGFILPAGQSGFAGSRHYRDQVARWLRGELWIVPMDVRRVRATDTLVLAR